MTLPKIAIGIPYYRTCEGPTLLSCMSAAMRTAAVFTKISTDEDKAGMLPIGTSGCYIEDNRNGLVNYFLQTGIPFTHLLWIDTDMTFPEDAWLRLLAHDKDIVGVNYRTRTPPYAAAGIYENGDVDTMAPGLVLMKQVPTGLLLTKFDLYRELPYPWFKPGLNGEARDDVYFCRLAQSRGYQVWCDNDLTKEIVHHDMQQIPWFRPDQIKQVTEVQGSQLNMQRGEAESKERAAMVGKLYEKSLHTAGAPGPGPDRPV
jgi:hypothetical protein